MAHGIRGMLEASLIEEYMDLHQKKQDTAGTRTMLYFTEHT